MFVTRSAPWTLAAAAVLLSGASAMAQSLEENLQKKLKEPFLTKAPWVTDYEKAKAESQKTGKAIFAYFTRSYSP
jgi:hypothetical protein